MRPGASGLARALSLVLRSGRVERRWSDAAHDYFKSAESCSMCGPKYCAMHNVRDVDWDAVCEVIAELKRERVAALAA